MTPQVSAVTFENPDGLKLFGIVHEPAPDRRTDLAIILLSPGVKMRVAPHRLYNKMAAAFVERGCRVLRFDFYGLGDSEGVIREAYLADLYASIQVGRYVGDTRVAIKWMRDTYGDQRFILGGLCGGAITAVLAAPSCDDVVGILALGLPVILDGTNVDRYRYLTAGQLKQTRTSYLRKLTNWRAWLRLLTLRSDYRLITRSIGEAVGWTAKQSHGGKETTDNSNTLFPPAFISLLSRNRPVLLLFSEVDRLWWEFEEKFLNRHREAVERYKDLLEIGVIAGANHVLTFESWQDDMLARSRAWLERRFPLAQAPEGLLHDKEVSDVSLDGSGSMLPGRRRTGWKGEGA